MKGLMNRTQLWKLREERYDLYEVLVAVHQWRKIKRRIVRVNEHPEYDEDGIIKKRHNYKDVVLKTKAEICNFFVIKGWLFNCLLCSFYAKANPDFSLACPECPLGDCDKGSPYNEAYWKGSLLACDEIIEAIEQDAKKRGVYDKH